MRPSAPRPGIVPVAEGVGHLQADLGVRVVGQSARPARCRLPGETGSASRRRAGARPGVVIRRAAQPQAPAKQVRPSSTHSSTRVSLRPACSAAAITRQAAARAHVADESQDISCLAMSRCQPLGLSRRRQLAGVRVCRAAATARLVSCRPHPVDPPHPLPRPACRASPRPAAGSSAGARSRSGTCPRPTSSRPGRSRACTGRNQLSVEARNSRVRLVRRRAAPSNVLPFGVELQRGGRAG